VIQGISDRTDDGRPQDIVELPPRIEGLQQQIDRLRREHNLKLEDLQRWLDSLRRRVRPVWQALQGPRGADVEPGPRPPGAPDLVRSFETPPSGFHGQDASCGLPLETTGK
jgi:hypothetical protein